MSILETYDPDAASDAPVPSPCVGVCTMNAATHVCNGCYRTRTELAEWSAASSDQKRKVWRAVKQRMPR